MCELALESEAPLVDEHLLLASAAAGHAARVVRALSDVEHDLRGTSHVARGLARARAATRGALASVAMRLQSRHWPRGAAQVLVWRR